MQQWLLPYWKICLVQIEALIFPKVLEENSRLLQEGEIIQLLGRVSAREEEDAKLSVTRLHRYLLQ